LPLSYPSLKTDSEKNEQANQLFPTPDKRVTALGVIEGNERAEDPV